MLTKTEDAANAMKHNVDNPMGLMSSAEPLATRIGLNDILRNEGGYDVVVGSPFERLLPMRLQLTQTSPGIAFLTMSSSWCMISSPHFRVPAHPLCRIVRSFDYA